MTKREKRLEKIKQNPQNVSFQEVSQLLEDYGFTVRKGKGSHYSFRLEIQGKVWKLVVPFKKPHVKAAYVRKALKIIEEAINLQQEENNDE